MEYFSVIVTFSINEHDIDIQNFEMVTLIKIKKYRNGYCAKLVTIHYLLKKIDYHNVLFFTFKN